MVARIKTDFSIICVFAEKRGGNKKAVYFLNGK